MDLADRPAIADLFADSSFDYVVNLGAQAGVRYSLENPHTYVDSNVVGFLNILEGCRNNKVKHLVFASSSSVYGANSAMPFSVQHNVDHPISLYAATKKANELLAHSYSQLYDIATTGLRFFTVYGTWGRPDMAYYSFTQKILAGKPIPVFNRGEMRRDFTYIDDVIEGLVRVIYKPAAPNPHWDAATPEPGSSFAPFKIYNIGNNKPEQLLHFIEVLESELGVVAKRDYLPMQPGDVLATYADVDDLQNDVGFSPNTSIDVGIKKFVDWYRWYELVRKGRAVEK
jgi:UDP-glucuronate 4-epimerase